MTISWRGRLARAQDDPRQAQSRVARPLALPLDDESQLYLKGHVSREIAEGDRKLSDAQLGRL